MYVPGQAGQPWTHRALARQGVDRYEPKKHSQRFHSNIVALECWSGRLTPCVLSRGSPLNRQLNTRSAAPDAQK